MVNNPVVMREKTQTELCDLFVSKSLCWQPSFMLPELAMLEMDSGL